jgi:glycerol uptake facilitator protein
MESSRMSKPPTLVAELIAEFLGTFVLILFGTGVVAMVVLFPANNPAATVHGGYTNITLGWGLAVTMGIYVAGKVSGGHLNPAVTLTLAVFRDFPWRKVLPYSVAQTAGAFLAAALTY